MPDTEELRRELAVPGAVQKPFRVEVRRRPAEGPVFQPESILIARPSLRTSGLLAALPPEHLRDLLMLLTFVSPNGDVMPSLVEVKDAMRVSEGKTRARLERLAAFHWRGEPIVAKIRRESGLHAFAPTPAILETMNAEAPEPEDERPHVRMATREAIVAHSRAAYARPRAEVEREIARLNGWPDPQEDAQTSEARDKLLLFGVPRDKAEDLISRHGAEEVLRQAKWLPYRRAKKPAQLLVAAIENGYGEPAALRLGHGGAADGQPVPIEESDSAGPHA